VVKLVKAILGVVTLGIVAVVAGFLAAWAFLTVWGSLFPFQEEWDDTWHEFLPVVIAYLTWFMTAILAFVLGLAMVRRRVRTGRPARGPSAVDDVPHAER
jgi:ABC-type Fe3+ transport system permease subunit